MELDGTEIAGRACRIDYTSQKRAVAVAALVSLPSFPSCSTIVTSLTLFVLLGDRCGGGGYHSSGSFQEVAAVPWAPQ